MSETHTGQQQDNRCLGRHTQDNSRETLKSLARKVIKQGASGVSSLGHETARQYGANSETPTRHEQDTDALGESQRRLGIASVCIAIFEDGSMRVVITERETLSAINDGGAVYSPADMHHYVQLEPSERRLLHQFKKRFGVTTEWKVKP